MGNEELPTRAPGRRLKFGSSRRNENPGLSQETPVRAEAPATSVAFNSSVAAIGERFTAAYVVVTQVALFGLQALQDWRAERRQAALRGAARARPHATPRGDASSSSARSNLEK